MNKCQASWRVNTPQLLREIGLVNTNGFGIMRMPIAIFSSILSEVAIRASELNDDKLNGLMARLALYEITDPYSKEYDEKITLKLIKKAGY